MHKFSPQFKKRWRKYSPIFQLANIGSEVNRAIYWQKKKDKKNTEVAFLRALALLDLSINSSCSGPQLKEMLRLREVLCDYFGGYGYYNTSSKSLENYFTNFALKAREGKSE